MSTASQEPRILKALVYDQIYHMHATGKRSRTDALLFILQYCKNDQLPTFIQSSHMGPVGTTRTLQDYQDTPSY